MSAEDLMRVELHCAELGLLCGLLRLATRWWVVPVLILVSIVSLWVAQWCGADIDAVGKDTPSWIVEALR